MGTLSIERYQQFRSVPQLLTYNVSGPEERSKALGSWAQRREIVEWLTLYVRAISVRTSPPLSFNVRILSARRATSEPDPRQTFGRLDLLLKRSKL